MTTIQFDHVGVNVHDLDRVTRFFSDLGFDCDGPYDLRGAWLDRLVGLEGAQADMVTATVPGTRTSVELLAYHEPPLTEGDVERPVNGHGKPHLAFRVDDVEQFRSRAQDAGYAAAGEIVHTGGALRLYIAGPESLFVEFIQPL